ncbi:MAG: peroxiredoxin [Paracoccaceae bacterium]|jgi:peroxiredoxin
MATIPSVCDFDWQAPDFLLPDTAGTPTSFKDIQGENGTLIMFICNHCPYVLGVLDHILRDASDLQNLGIGVAAISANDVAAYPQDSFENMGELARAHQFSFPYLYDETQDTARAYDAACTPDFFGFNKAGGLQYRGRFEGSNRDLFEAMKSIAETGQGPRDQIPSMGCSIKWKSEL